MVIFQPSYIYKFYMLQLQTLLLKKALLHTCVLRWSDLSLPRSIFGGNNSDVVCNFTTLLYTQGELFYQQSNSLYCFLLHFSSFKVSRLFAFLRCLTDHPIIISLAWKLSTLQCCQSSPSTPRLFYWSCLLPTHYTCDDTLLLKLLHPIPVIQEYNTYIKPGSSSRSFVFDSSWFDISLVHFLQ